MEQSKIKVGSYVIINHTDKPCTRLIAQVTGADYEHERVIARYICKGTNQTTCTGRLSEATLVEDFGVDLIFDRDLTVKIGMIKRASVATYKDGRPRQWQENGEALIQELRPAPVESPASHEIYVVGQLDNQNDDDPQFTNSDQAYSYAKERSGDDQVWAVWRIIGDDEDPELEALVYQKTVFTS